VFITYFLAFKALLPILAKPHIINQWMDLSGNRFYILYEAESAEAYGAFNLPWSDICIIDSVPVMEASEFMKLLPKYKKQVRCNYGIFGCRS
jgi:hypothetical protein